MKIFALTAILSLISLNAYNQNLIGYNDREIRKYMKANYRNMNLDKVTNNLFKYLKYSDNSDNQTLLFFLNSDSICKSVRMICDLNLKTEKVKEFNTVYKTSVSNRWIDERDGKNYLIEVKDEKWSCIITIEPEK
jgi:predicted glycosyltransferase involved in capsule biosynthesis